MTIDDLVSACWDGLPPVRKRLAGREAVRRIVVDAVQDWDADALAACGDSDARKAYEEKLAWRIERRCAAQQEYGFVLMSIILVAVISAVVQWLVKWWLDNHFNRDSMARLQQEFAA